MQKNRSKITKYQLKNGLTVILKPQKTAPVISFNIGIKIGSLWEKKDEAGLSHVLEHMVFKGTKSFKPGEIASIVESCGGELNAFTSYDQTVYYINLASKHQKMGLKLIKEMVLDAIINEEELKKEIEVVIEEMRRGNDNPSRNLIEQIFQKTFKNHPYANPIIGSEKVVRSLSAKKVREFYKKWYTPNNMTLAICGDFNLSTMKKMIEKSFKGYQSQKITYPKLSKINPISKNIVHRFGANIETNYLGLGFILPPYKHADIPKIDILSYLLGGNETSRLEQNIKENKSLATYIASFAYTPQIAGLFIVDAMVPSQKIDRILPAIFDEISWTQNNFFTEDEINRTKQNLLNSLIYEQQTCEGQARKWITYENIAGDYRYEEEYLESLKKVSAHDIREVARKYLPLNKAVIIHQHPKKLKAKIRIPKAPVIKPSFFFTQTKKINKVREFKLNSGVKLITLENRDLPIISSYLAKPGGLRRENKNNNGISRLMTDLIEKESLNHSAIEISRIQESISGSVGSFTGKNSWGLSAQFISKYQTEAFDLMFDLLLNPSFSKNEFSKEKKLTLELIKQQEDSLAHLAIKNFLKELYPNHPYGMPNIGERKSVSSLQLKDIQSFYQKSLNAKEITMAVVGDFKTEVLTEKLAEYLIKIPTQKIQKTKLTIDKNPSKTKRVVTYKNKEQVHLVLGFKACDFNSKDRYILEVINHLLSGQGGRLFLELRDKKSLCYTVNSFLVTGIDPGYFAVYMGVEPSKVDQAIDGICEELNRLVSQKVSKAELDRAQNYLIGSQALDLQKRSYLASTLCFNGLYGQELNEIFDYSQKIMKVSIDDIQRVAKKYFKLNAYILSLVGPIKK
jgi:zinc protease